MNKEKIIIIEGIDRSGKDSVRREITKLTNGKSLVIIRAFISQIAYSRIFNRKINEQFFFDKAKEAAKHGVITIYLSANRSEIAKRILETNEIHITENEIDNHLKIFENVISEFQAKNLKIYSFDTGFKSATEIAAEINLI